VLRYRNAQHLAGIKQSAVRSPDLRARASSALWLGPHISARSRFSLINQGKEYPIMANRVDAATSARYHLNGLAHVMERIGLAIMGALCGLFVAAMVAKANIEEINSFGALVSAVLYGSLGFYLGTNIPSLSPSQTFSNIGSGPRTIALASAIGTFVAAVAALVSVFMIIFDETPPVIWNVGIGFGWMLGVLLQLAAGTAARLKDYNSAPG
jgi:lysylphosphatidylglycerol synthetase-like protein (DUF2156 family)